MKITVRLLFLFFFAFKLHSQTATQTNKLIFLDSTWAESSSDNYKYLRIIEGYCLEKQSYIVKEYYKSSVLKSIGNTLDREIIKKDGQFISYYENGKRESIETFSKGKKIGKEFNWYENGNPKSELEYFNLKDGKTECKLYNFWNSDRKQTVIDGTGDYNILEESCEESGKIKNGLPEGIWKGKNLKKKSSFVENYENGKLVSGITTDSLNIEHLYTVKNQEPSPKRGINSFYNYVANAMYIPYEVRNKISGKIFLTFIVDEEGNLVEPKIKKGIGYGLDENALELIKKAKKWNPGLLRGVPVRVLYSLPLTIKTAQ